MLKGIRLNRILIATGSVVAFALSLRYGYGLTAIAVGSAITTYAGLRVYSLFKDIEQTVSAAKQLIRTAEIKVTEAELIMESLNRFIRPLAERANQMLNNRDYQEDENQIEVPAEIIEMVQRLEQIGQRANGRIDAIRNQEAAARAPILNAAPMHRQPATAVEPRRSDRLAERRPHP
jgi:dsDNA-specific endonuclease/ATPase MutS2